MAVLLETGQVWQTDSQTLVSPKNLLLSVNLSGEIVHASGDLLEVLGYSSREVIGKSCLKLIHPIYYKSCIEFYEGIKSGSATANSAHEVGFLTKKGEPLILKQIAKGIQDNDQLIQCAYSPVSKPNLLPGTQDKESRYRLLVELANVGIFYCLPDGHMDYINKQAVDISGYSASELMEINFRTLISSKYKRSVLYSIIQQRDDQIESSYREFPIIRKDGQEEWIGLTLTIIFSNKENNRIAGCIGVVCQLKEKKKVYEKLRGDNLILRRNLVDQLMELKDTNNRLRKQIKLRQLAEKENRKVQRDFEGLFLNANDSILIFKLDEYGTICEANPAACKTYGYDRQELIGMTLRDLSDRGYSNSQSIPNLIAKQGMLTKYEDNRITHLGEKVVIEVSTSVIEYKGEQMVLSIGRDITMRKELEILRERARKNDLNVLIEGQELERKRIARELHDSVGQLLIATKISVRNLADQEKDSQSQKILNDIQDLNEKTYDEVRRISRNLLPDILQNFGLQLALGRLVNDLNFHSDLNIILHKHGMFRRPSIEIEIGIYRIVQEAINNAIKHSLCKNIDVSIISGENNNEVRIEDDGKGFDVREAFRNMGIGLQNMIQRAELIGASIDIQSTKDKGTSITILF